MVGNIAAMWAIFGALTGAVLASWVSAVTYRIPRGIDIIRERSQCTSCLTPVAGQDNVPILGWVFLRGRCRTCDDRISVRYPLLEIGGLAVGAVVGWFAGPIGVIAALVLVIGVPVLIHYWKAGR